MMHQLCDERWALSSRLPSSFPGSPPPPGSQCGSWFVGRGLFQLLCSIKFQSTQQIHQSTSD